MRIPGAEVGEGAGEGRVGGGGEDGGVMGRWGGKGDKEGKFVEKGGVGGEREGGCECRKTKGKVCFRVLGLAKGRVGGYLLSTI